MSLEWVSPPKLMLTEGILVAFSQDFTNVYQLARAAAELEMEWPVPAEVLAPFRSPSEPVDKGMVRTEFIKVLKSPAPSRFFKVLRATNKLGDYFGHVFYLIGSYIGGVLTASVREWPVDGR